MAYIHWLNQAGIHGPALPCIGHLGQTTNRHESQLLAWFAGTCIQGFVHDEAAPQATHRLARLRHCSCVCVWCMHVCMCQGLLTCMLMCVRLHTCIEVYVKLFRRLLGLHACVTVRARMCVYVFVRALACVNECVCKYVSTKSQVWPFG